MSYEKKMKDLLARLAAMSPEPPPYPEEIQMARPESRKTARPALAFAVAAVFVAILAVPLLLFTGGEEPLLGGSTTTTTVPVTSTTAPIVTTTVPEVTTSTDGTTETTDAVLPVWSQPVYLYQMPTNSFGNNPTIVPVWIEVTPLSPDEEFTAALSAVGSNLPESLENAIPPEVQIVELTTSVIDGTEVWVADMNQAFLDGAGGALADFTMLNQLIYTLTANQIQSVLFTVDGAPVDTFGSEGLILTEPVSRETFREGNLGLIFLTRPLLETEGAYLVEGMANVTEATLTLEVLNGEGTSVHEETVTATCGTGCWGEFSATIPAELIVPGESSIRLFTHSLEDGSDTEVITVPIPEGDVWQFTAGG